MPNLRTTKYYLNGHDERLPIPVVVDSVGSPGLPRLFCLLPVPGLLFSCFLFLLFISLKYVYLSSLFLLVFSLFLCSCLGLILTQTAKTKIGKYNPIWM